MNNYQRPKVIEEKLDAIESNQTLELVNSLEKQKLIDVKWVYKTKLKPNHEVDKYKVRLVAKGFLQRPSLDY